MMKVYDHTRNPDFRQKECDGDECETECETENEKRIH